MLKMFDNDPTLTNHILWSEEAIFELRGQINWHNAVWWSVENLHTQLEVPNSRQSVMVWCGISSAGLVGPHFFDQTINTESYLRVLEELVWPYVRHRCLTFQKDGAAAHYAKDVHAWLDKKFGKWWIGRCGPLEWPARSPDLTPCDFFFWGYLKDHVYKTQPATILQLRDRIQQCYAELPVEMCTHVCHLVMQRFQKCLEIEGGQIHD
jgi:hypothetical protein